MKQESIRIRTFALNSEALAAQEYLKDQGVETFIIMEGYWPAASAETDSSQQIHLVTRPADADRAKQLLAGRPVDSPDVVPARKPSTGRFFRKAAWMLGVLFIFSFAGAFRDGVIDPLEMLPAALFLIAAIGFFVLSSFRERNHNAAPSP